MVVGDGWLVHRQQQHILDECGDYVQGQLVTRLLVKRYHLPYGRKWMATWGLRDSPSRVIIILEPF